jgi:drug/metabolite transporter (DMT)-like permease
MTTGVSARVWVALGLVYVVWGSTYLAIRVVVEADLPPLLAMGSRFVTAGLLLAGLLVATRRGLGALRVTRANLLGAGVMGAFLLLGGNGMVAIGEQTVPSGLAALIVGSVPLWFALLRVAGGERPRLVSWAGVLVGFAGVAAITLPAGGIEGVEAWGVGLVVVASILWSIGSYLSPRLHLPADALVATTYEMLLGGALLLLGGTVRGELGGLDLGAVDRSGWVALAYLVVVGSIVGYSAYVYALSHAPLSLVGTYAYVNPVVAVFLGWAILSEPITTVVVGGGLLVVLGVALVVRGERRPAPAEDAEPQSLTDPEEELSARR